MLHHCSFYWSSVKSFLANCFLIIGDHFCLHFYNIRQCQLTISWVAMVTCGPIVFPKVLWMQHLRIIFDFNALDRMQIFKSIPMVINWYKTEIAQYFYKWCFFLYLLPDRNKRPVGLYSPLIVGIMTDLVWSPSMVNSYHHYLIINLSIINQNHHQW